jgi:hypothetical protein
MDGRGRLRHAAFLGLRGDRAAKHVHREPWSNAESEDQRMTFGTCQPVPGPVVFAHMKTPTTRQQLLRARRYLVLLGLAGALGLEALVYFNRYFNAPLPPPRR